MITYNANLAIVGMLMTEIPAKITEAGQVKRDEHRQFRMAGIRELRTHLDQYIVRIALSGSDADIATMRTLTADLPKIDANIALAG